MAKTASSAEQAGGPLPSSGPRVALILGGGGIAGYSFHAATLGALRAVTGWDPRTASVLIGTSAGSVVGALVTGGVAVEELLSNILSAPTNPALMSRLRLVSGRGLASPFGFGLTGVGMSVRQLCRFPRSDLIRMFVGLLPKGVVETSSVGEDALSLHGPLWPTMPFWVPALDAKTGERVVFGRDMLQVPVHRAVEASCSVPALFRPVRINGRSYIDGGVHSATNADLVLDVAEPFDLVVILSPMSFQRAIAIPSPNSALRYLPAIQLRQEVKAITEAGMPVLVIEPSSEVVRAVGPNPMDPTKLIPVLMESSNSAFDVLERPENQTCLEILRSCAAELISPPDVPFPEPAI